MGKRIVCLITVIAVSLSLFGCSDRKSKELTNSERELFTSLTKAAVSFEINTRYTRSEPDVTVEEITAYETDGSPYSRTDFTATGYYSVKAEDHDTYFGTFEVSGFSEGHGSGWDSCEITTPTHGFKELREKTVETTADPDVTTESTTMPTMYEPLSEYISEHITLMGTYPAPATECDINGDGHPELCTTVTAGSGIISTMIVVYDVVNDQGYMLNDRGDYDYAIEGASEDVLAVSRREFGGDKVTLGTVKLTDVGLVFTPVSVTNEIAPGQEDITVVTAVQE